MSARFLPAQDAAPDWRRDPRTRKSLDLEAIDDCARISRRVMEDAALDRQRGGGG
jgi:hypothetical protein